MDTKKKHVIMVVISLGVVAGVVFLIRKHFQNKNNSESSGLISTSVQDINNGLELAVAAVGNGSATATQEAMVAYVAGTATPEQISHLNQAAIAAGADMTHVAGGGKGGDAVSSAQLASTGRG